MNLSAIFPKSSFFIGVEVSSVVLKKMSCQGNHSREYECTVFFAIAPSTMPRILAKAMFIQFLADENLSMTTSAAARMMRTPTPKT